MAVNPMMNIGINGVLSGVKGLQQAAQDIAGLNLGSASERSGGPAQDAGVAAPGSADVLDAIHDLKVYERQVQASAKVVETADAVLGMLLDTRV